MTEIGLTKNAILSELSRSAHGKLAEYIDVGKRAAKQEPEFLAHLVAWNRSNGQIRDSKIALPVVSLAVEGFPPELAENSLAHLALLTPKELVKAFRFAKEVKTPGRMMSIRRLVAQYVRELESKRGDWNRVATQHRRALKELYALGRVGAVPEWASAVLFGFQRREDGNVPLAYPQNSVFEAIANLKNMAPIEAAGVILERKIPFLIAKGALYEKAKDQDLVLALIGRMSPSELVTHTKELERLGLKTNPALKGAFEAALERASKSKKNVLKTTRAAEQIDDEHLKEKLRGLQERQIGAMKGVEGNWLVLGDKSGSMKAAIELSRQVSATLAKMVKGKVYLVFFDTQPRGMDVTGLSLDQIIEKTKYVNADGGTSIGCGLQWALENKLEIDGVAVVSDGGENNAPWFHDVLKRYNDWSGKNIPVYLYHTLGDRNVFTPNMKTVGFDVQEFEMHKDADYYSLPNVVQTMRTNRYSLIDEVMSTKLLTLSDVFKAVEREEVSA